MFHEAQAIPAIQSRVQSWAIRLVEAGDKTATQVARGLDIRVNHLGKWKLQREREALTRVPAHSPVDRCDGSGTIDPDTFLT